MAEQAQYEDDVDQPGGDSAENTQNQAAAAANAEAAPEGATGDGEAPEKPEDGEGDDKAKAKKDAKEGDHLPQGEHKEKTPAEKEAARKHFLEREEKRQKARELELENAELKGRLKAIEEFGLRKPAGDGKGSPDGEDKRPVRPRMKDFEDNEAYEAAMDKYEADVEAFQERKLGSQLKKGTTEAERQMQAAKAFQAFEEKRDGILGEMAKEFGEDAVQIITHAKFPITPAMRDAAFESQASPKILGYLVDHPDEAQRISGLSPVAQVREMDKIERIVTAKPQPRVPQAPVPVRPVRGGAEPTVDETRINDDDWYKRRFKKSG